MTHKPEQPSILRLKYGRNVFATESNDPSFQRKAGIANACNIIEHKRIPEWNATVEKMLLLIKAALLNNTSRWQRLPSPLRILPRQQSNKYIREGFERGYWNITWTYIAIYYCIWDKETAPWSGGLLFFWPVFVTVSSRKIKQKIKILV